jgi:hypothetical protein
MTAVFFEKRDELCQEQKTEAACGAISRRPLSARTPTGAHN